MKHALLLIGIVTMVAVTTVPACKRQSPPPAPPPTAPPAQPAAKAPPAPPPPQIACPPESTFTPLGGKGRVLHTACTVFSPNSYWLAATLSYDQQKGKAGRAPKLSFLSGSAGGKVIVFDIQPLPVAAIEKLIKDNKQVAVQIRRTREDRSLVRLGVTGSSANPAKPDLSEIGMLLQLVAHQPPKILWTGPGDQITTKGDCISEERVEFEMLFRSRLERFNVTKSRPVVGGSPEACAAGPSMQETVAFKGVALARGRTLGEDSPPDPAKP
jgi:hypothetical protein